MHSRPLSSLGRILLAASCVAGLAATSLYAQNSSSSASSNTASKAAAPAEPYASRWDIFAGYSYLAPHGTITIPGAASANTPPPSEGVAARGRIGGDLNLLPNQSISTIPTGPIKYSSIDYGAIGSVAYFFNRYVGGQAEYANHPDGNNDSMSTAQGGIIFRFPMQGMTPWIHGLAGANRLQGAYGQPFTWGPALTAGGGLDYTLPFFGHHLGLRLFQADYEYTHTNFGPQPPVPVGGSPNPPPPPPVTGAVRVLANGGSPASVGYITGGRANLSSARLSTGLLLHLGSITPPPPVTYTCSASPDSVYPGEPVTVTGSAVNVNPKKTATYSWTGSNGVKAEGNTATANVDTHDLQPGSYTVTGHVSEGQKAGQFADCTANFTVKQYEPPTVSCSANPSTVKPGETSTITAQGVSPQNRPLTYTYSASAGQVSGTGNTATLNTTGAPAGPITVTATVQDDKGQTATCTATVDVQAPPPPVAKTQTLCSINFDRDKRRPARVDNEAKACLDDVALNLQQQPDATAVLVGNSASNERHADKLAAQRAVNTKEYLVKEKGVDASRISVRTGNEGGKEVQNYLVPQGANFDNDVTGTTPVNESEFKAQPRNGRRAAHHRHHHKAAAKK